MISLIEKKGEDVSMSEVERALSGNLCRCTGYRPIVESFKPFCKDAPDDMKLKLADIEDLCNKRKFCSKSGAPCSGTCSENSTSKLTAYKAKMGEQGSWTKVKTCKDAQELMKKDNDYVLVAGNTAQGANYIYLHIIIKLY
jgi:xanthine dehydrogenase/oxidase